jgi:glycine/D-amino acid oxidase-like deaminating enzyme
LPKQVDFSHRQAERLNHHVRRVGLPVSVSSAFLKDARIAVIGAGAVGSVVSYRLAQAGANVTIIDQHHPGWGTSGNSFAWLNSFGKTPRYYHQLNVRSIREHQDLASELNGTWIHLHGGIAWERTDNPERNARLKERAKALHQWGYRVEVVSPQEVTSNLEPDLHIDPGNVEEVYITPIEGWINAIGLCHAAVSEAVRRYNATFRKDEVIGFGQAQGTINAVKLASGETLEVDAVINASGPSAARIADMAGIDLPITRQPGLLIVSAPAPVHLKHVVHTPDLNLRDDGGWRVMIHGEDFDEQVADEHRLELSDPFVTRAMERAAEAVPNLKGIEAEGVRVGVRPMPNDGHPIIGFDPEVAGFYHTVMHSGITLCAAVGNLVTEDLMGTAPPELEPFRIERFIEGKAKQVHATIE